MSKFADVFSKLTQEKNISLRSLSQDIGISSSQLSKYQSGNYQPSLKNAILISTYFKCSLDYLFGLTDIKYMISNKTETGNVKDFYHRFLYILKLRKMNFNSLSKKTFINRNTFYSWQYKTEFPKASLIAVIAQNLNTTMEYLIGRSKEINYGI